MTFGVCLQVYNHIHFNNRGSIWMEFVPQMLYLWSIFGYLVFLIIFKWLSYYPDPSKAPGLLNTLIYLVLSPGTIAMQLYPGQATVQVVLILIAFISIPWMLCAKPYYLYLENKKTIGAGYSLTPGLTDGGEAGHVENESHAVEEITHEHGHGVTIF